MAVEEGRHKAVDGMPHHRKVVALSTDLLQRAPAMRTHDVCHQNTVSHGSIEMKTVRTQVCR